MKYEERSDENGRHYILHTTIQPIYRLATLSALILTLARFAVAMSSLFAPSTSLPPTSLSPQKILYFTCITRRSDSAFHTNNMVLYRHVHGWTSLHAGEIAEETI